MFTYGVLDMFSFVLHAPQKGLQQETRQKTWDAIVRWLSNLLYHIPRHVFICLAGDFNEQYGYAHSETGSTEHVKSFALGPWNRGLQTPQTAELVHLLENAQFGLW